MQVPGLRCVCGGGGGGGGGRSLRVKATPQKFLL